MSMQPASAWFRCSGGCRGISACALRRAPFRRRGSSASGRATRATKAPLPWTSCVWRSAHRASCSSRGAGCKRARHGSSSRPASSRSARSSRRRRRAGSSSRQTERRTSRMRSQAKARTATRASGCGSRCAGCASRRACSTLPTARSKRLSKRSSPSFPARSRGSAPRPAIRRSSHCRDAWTGTARRASAAPSTSMIRARLPTSGAVSATWTSHGSRHT
jgi:hypothetical protein